VATRFLRRARSGTTDGGGTRQGTYATAARTRPYTATTAKRTERIGWLTRASHRRPRRPAGRPAPGSRGARTSRSRLGGRRDTVATTVRSRRRLTPGRPTYGLSTPFIRCIATVVHPCRLGQARLVFRGTFPKAVRFFEAVRIKPNKRTA